MAGDIEELRNFTRSVGDWAKRHLKYDSWNPVKAALLLSGIEPSARWSDFVELEKQDDSEPISCSELFARVHSTLKKPERGADGEPVFKDSVRFLNAEIILNFWDNTCDFQKLYPLELDPKSFVGWLFRGHQKGNPILQDSMWLYVFASYSGTESPFRVLPRELLDEKHQPTVIDETLLPKHRFRAEIVQAWNEARKAGAGENDPDAILSRLAEMIKQGKIEGVELESYSRKSDITYKISGAMEPQVLFRNSFARQLRRMNQTLADREATRSKPSGHVSPEGDFPVIARVLVDPKIISRFTGDEKLIKLARDLLRETITYVRVFASLQFSETGCESDEAVLIGYLGRLSKLLLSIDNLAALGLGESLALIVPLTMETMINLGYLIVNFADKDLIESYIGHSAEKTRGVEKWTSLTLEEKAHDIGFDDLYAHVLLDAPSSLHGSWEDLSKYHLNSTSENRYHAKLTWAEPNPRLLVNTSRVALAVARGFSNLFDAPVLTQLRSGLGDLSERLQMADELLEQWLYARW